MAWPLVGREAEFARVGARLAAGSGLLIVGEPGVGKTRLARAGLDAAYARGARAEWVAGSTGAAGIPLAAVAHLVPDVEGDEGDPARVVRIASRALSAPPYGALVIGLDDAHTVDAASAAVLHHAVVTGNASLLATARRGVALPEPIDGLVRDGRLERLDLLPLAAADVLALVTAALGGPVDGGTGDALCAASEGNPMFLRELVYGGLETGALARRDGLWTWDGPIAAPRLTDLVDARLGRLSPHERAAVETLAVGAPLALDVADTIVGPEVLAALDRLELLDVRSDAGRAVVQLAHPLYSEVLRATLSPLRRRSIHTSLAAALAGATPSSADTLRVVTWRLAAGEPNQLDHVRVAARRAMGAADFELAERIARAGADAGDHESSVILGMALAGQGRIDDAHAALAAAGTEGTADVVRRAVDIFFYGSRTTNAAEAVERVQRVLSDAADWPDRGEPLVDAARAGMLLLEGNVREARAVAERVVANPQASVVTQLRSLLVAGPAAAIEARTTDGLTYSDYGLRLLEGGHVVNSADGDALVEFDAGFLLVANRSLSFRFAGRLADARAVAQEGYRETLVDRSPAIRGLFSLAVGMVEYAEGRVADALRLCRESVALLRRPPSVYLVWSLGYLAQAAATLGDESTAAAALEEADRHRSATFQVFDCDLRQGETLLLALRGDLDAARRLALEATKIAADGGQIAFAAHAAHDAARLGVPDAAAALLDDFARQADGYLIPAYAAHAQALAARDPQLLGESSITFERLGWRLFAAEAAASAAGLVDGEQSRVFAARARALSGDSGGARTPALSTLGRTPVLTEREHEVARLAADGLSNRDIAARLHISVRTVDNHLHRAYEKLGIRGRDELAATLS